MMHENDAAEVLAKLCGHENMIKSEPSEGKIDRFKIPLIPFFALGWFEILSSKRKEDELAVSEEKNTQEETTISND